MNKGSLSKAQLLALKDEITEARTKVSELKGKQSYLMTQLKEQYGCATITEAEKKLEKLDKQIGKMQDQIKIGTQALEEKYELIEEEE